MKTELQKKDPSDYELFRLLRDLHVDDESCWKSVREAKAAYRRFRRVQLAMEDNEFLNDEPNA